MFTIKNAHNFTKKRLIRMVNNMLHKRHIANHIDDELFRSKLIEYNMQRPYGCDPTICHAPMRSLYFGFNGIVTACCFNRQYILGKFPENTIEEIINGDKRKLLQQNLDRIDFSLGCDYCKDFIIRGNYMSVGAYYADTIPAQNPAGRKIPTEMVFELDNSCNLKCEMCNAKFSSAHNGGKRIVAPYDSNEFVEQLKPFIPYLTTTKFMGGEPFMSDIYPRIWELIISLNPKCMIQVQSNGTILNDKIKSILQRGNFQIGLSIDTLNPERYKKIRTGTKIENTLKNLEFFKQISEKNGMSLHLAVCPMKENRFDIPELVTFCNRKKILINFNNVYTENFTLSDLSIQELDELAIYYKKSNPKGYNYISIHNHIAFSNLIKSIECIKEQYEQNKIQYEYMNEMIPCSQKEFVEMMLLIIGDDESIDIERGRDLLKYIPENFLIKRSEYLYFKNRMSENDLKSAINAPLEYRIKYFKENFIDITN